MITGLTEDKLFRIKTFDSAEPYKIGYNGVTDLYKNSEGETIIKYSIDNIFYITTYTDTLKKENLDFVEYDNPEIKINSFKGDINNIVRGSTNFNIIDSKSLKFKKTIRPNNRSNTVVVTKKNSYEKFVKKKILKKDRYIGFTSMPEVKSEILIERDELTVFERHQRLSEINNLAELETYRNGYYKIVNTI